MSVLIATPKALDANSLVTLERADAIAATRLYVSDWEEADGPTAEGYAISADALAGVNSIAVKDGTGDFQPGTKFKIGSSATVYTAANHLEGDGSLRIAPALAADITTDDVVTRLTPGTKEQALMWATRLMDQMIDWSGSPTDTDQRLRHPRSGMFDRDGDDYDSDTIALPVEEMCVDLAIELIRRNRFADPDLLGLGFSDVKLGPLSVKVDRAAQEETIPSNLLAMISHIGTITGAASKGAKSIRLERS